MSGLPRHTPTQAARAVAVEFNGFTISPQVCERYDLLRRAGRTLCEPLRLHFFRTRIFFDAGLHRRAIKENRALHLAKAAQDLTRQGRYLEAAKMWEQVAKEEGGWFKTRRFKKKAKRANEEGTGSLGFRWDLSRLSEEERLTLAAIEEKCTVGATPSTFCPHRTSQND